ncbi:MAG: hypothetical protein QOE45_2662 [Frankiaceae bacterium]|jgi:hypothetical protein|nr:hypothetical protein [Frankiaceae bacterium]
MKRLALLAATGLTGVLALPAHAAPEPTGPLCGFASVTNPGLESGTQSGGFFGGPLRLGDDTNPLIVYSASITCSIQVNEALHSGGDGASFTSRTSGNVAVVEPTSGLSYSAGTGDDVFICTQVNLVGGTTLYYDDASQNWSTNSASRCELATPLTPQRSIIDPIICPLLAPFFPPEGDVGIFWDCPPYHGVPAQGYFHAPTVHT